MGIPKLRTMLIMLRSINASKAKSESDKADE